MNFEIEQIDLLEPLKNNAPTTKSPFYFLVFGKLRGPFKVLNDTKGNLIESESELFNAIMENEPQIYL